MKKTHQPNLLSEAAPASNPTGRDAPADDVHDLFTTGSGKFGQQREVTLLFADLRRFTDLSAALDAEAVYELLGQVMDCLTHEVIAQGGQVIDYYGDGLAAMWNAPSEQPDHADRACLAAMAMIELLPDVAADWAALIDGRELRLGIGIHSGTAQVGNAGSRHVNKYGPRGANVHLASRVEAATKKIGVSIVLSGQSAVKLSDHFPTYRICRAELPGIEMAVELFGLVTARADAESMDEIKRYGCALELFERGEFSQAAEVLATLPEGAAAPKKFLADVVSQRLGQQQRRRSGDPPPGPFCGVIRIETK